MTLVADRVCGACTLCCKTYRIPVLEKPAGVLCRHCVINAGCSIFASSPQVCRDYFCLWRREPSLDEQWHPYVAGFLLMPDENSGNLAVCVDPDLPDSWRREPYESQLRQWAKEGAGTFRHVVVHTNEHAMLIMPDRDIDIGPVRDHERIIFSYSVNADGIFEPQPRVEAA